MPAVLAIAYTVVTAEHPPFTPTLSGETRTTFSTLDKQDATFVYRLSNTSKYAYTVSRVGVSCGCLAAALSSREDKPALTLPVTLAPGQSLTVRAMVRLSELRPGRFHKFLTVWGHPANAVLPKDTVATLSQAEPLARVEIVGTLVSPVLFAREMSGKPARLSDAPVALGRVVLSDTQVKSATDFVVIVTPDPRLFTGGTAGESAVPPAPPLVSSHPSITVTRLATPAENTVLIGAGKTERPATLRYRVQVAANAPLGPFLAGLRFAPPPVPGNHSEADLRREQAWRTATLLVSGEVVGDLSVSPSLVTFVLDVPPKEVAGNTGLSASKPTDPALTKQVVLTAAHADIFAGLTIRSDNPLVRAKIQPASQVSASPAHCVITVTLSPDVYKAFSETRSRASRAGSAFGSASGAETALQTYVTLTLTNGRKIVLPVSIYGLASKPSPP